MILTPEIARAIADELQAMLDRNKRMSARWRSLMTGHDRELETWVKALRGWAHQCETIRRIGATSAAQPLSPTPQAPSPGPGSPPADA